MRSFALAAALVSISSVAAETFTIAVGGNNTLTYDPKSITAKDGDIIQFQFLTKNHTVTQSTFADPCTKMTTPTEGVDSGFMPVAVGATQIPSWSFTLNNASGPLWFYCRQKTPASHCQAGMVFAVNPTADKTFDAFQKLAMGGAANGTTTSTGGAGGNGGSTSTGGNGGSTSTGGTGGSTSTSTTTGGGNPSTTGTGSGDGSGSGTNSSATPNGNNGNGAVSMTMNAAGLVSIAGLVVGLML
ncbi:hypothetical protein E1B28_012152 [Marasmius oreades]|uniref:Cupredoxin n=1 Tax=Marasmius oreades TaxID=181124 RepID=A0A9P7UNE7_9AGAR|nr:uncharacterized protein E1B28_012152 [Marasmius oreades]KAG7088128.1 hypothetical protein E1B28_012152 [Marasmius oreades]